MLKNVAYRSMKTVQENINRTNEVGKLVSRI